MANADGRERGSGGVIVVIGNERYRCFQETVVPEESAVVCGSDIGSRVALAFGVDSYFFEFSYWLLFRKFRYF